MNDETSIVKTIGRYHAVGELGRGAMGVVYQGFDPVIGRSVALKTLAIAGSDIESAQLRERLYREAAAAGTLTHPNIVTIYDVIEDGGTTAVAMELVEGRTLADLIAEKGALPLDRALELFTQVCSALDYAGAKGIVHRDIKPANILLTADDRVKVTDFGIARIAIAGLTQTGTIMGSPSYMSPEQVRGLPLDPRSDLFSAAVVLYEMLTGERPFGGDDIATTMYRIVNEPPRSLDQTNATVGPAVSAVLQRALAKNPDDRYPTGSELVAELTRSVAMPCMPVLPPNLSVQPIAAPARRSPIIYVIAALAVALVAVVLFGLLGGGKDAPPGQAVEVASETPDAQPSGVMGAAPAFNAPEPLPTAPVPTASSYSGPVSTVPPPTGGAGRLPEPAPLSPATPIQRQPAAVGSGGLAPIGREVSGRPVVGAESPRAAVPSSGQPTAAPVVAPPPVAPATTVAAPATKPAPVERTVVRDNPALAPVGAAPPTPPPPVAVPSAPPAPSEAVLRIEFDGPAYPVTLYADDARLGRVDGPGGSVTVEPGALRVRAVSETVFLSADVGGITLRAGERRSITMPGLGSAVVSVKGEDYAGVRILVDGRPLPGPYPAQIARIAAGAHRVTFRWVSGPRAGTEISDALNVSAGAHYVVRAVPDTAQIVVQQLR